MKPPAVAEFVESANAVPGTAKRYGPFRKDDGSSLEYVVGRDQMKLYLHQPEGDHPASLMWAVNGQSGTMQCHGISADKPTWWSEPTANASG